MPGYTEFLGFTETVANISNGSAIYDSSPSKSKKPKKTTNINYNNYKEERYKTMSIEHDPECILDIISKVKKAGINPRNFLLIINSLDESQKSLLIDSDLFNDKESKMLIDKIFNKSQSTDTDEELDLTDDETSDDSLKYIDSVIDISTEQLDIMLDDFDKHSNEYRAHFDKKLRQLSSHEEGQ